ncbi:MAG: DUF6036 family nucleotidyltransferase [Acidimicrobiales bacterium]
MLDRRAILEALGALDEELGRSAIRANLFVVGGAAMTIAYGARRSTADVDAAFAPSSEVRRASVVVAERLALPEDWLNDGAKAFMPGVDPARIIVFEGSHLQVAAASPRYLLAMKLLAARVERDQDDVRTLYDLCGFTTVAEGLAVVEAAYPDYVIPPRTRFMLEEMFPTPEHQRDLKGDRDTGLDISF